MLKAPKLDYVVDRTQGIQGAMMYLALTRRVEPAHLHLISGFLFGLGVGMFLAGVIR